ncbi:hypothetical protein EIN_016660 [Entamoeba invadens IP1]|uniref:hypothetical protein n=1 Tax=Entamoeba invadens IP1 TaxID=370355 RepID=UPI0002C3E9A2|nr:hypothetical protein EIN_016660 [Entamoeba invadens IP1]ELP90437.1 hypothetical protein EIN_016660 [Entamoeba invadens IP1]|eukprot:XP_004257208.1 hypothetical protein EIN_016660 [Entamoeba invadens IP1]
MLEESEYHHIIPFLKTLSDAQTLSIVSKKLRKAIETLPTNPCYSVFLCGKEMKPNASTLRRELSLFKGITCFDCGSQISKLVSECKRFAKILNSSCDIPSELTHKVISTTFVPKDPSSFEQLESVVAPFPSDLENLKDIKKLKKVVIYITEDEVISQLYSVVVSLPKSVNVIIHFGDLCDDSLKLLQKTQAILVADDFRKGIPNSNKKCLMYLSEYSTLIFQKVKHMLPFSLEIFLSQTALLHTVKCGELKEGNHVDFTCLDGVQELKITESAQHNVMLSLPVSLTSLVSDLPIDNLSVLTSLKDVTTSYLPDIPVEVPIFTHPNFLANMHVVSSKCESCNLSTCDNLRTLDVSDSDVVNLVFPQNLQQFSLRKCNKVTVLHLVNSLEKVIIEDCENLQEVKGLSKKLVGFTFRNCKKVIPFSLESQALKTVLYKSTENVITNIDELKAKSVACLDF